MTREDALSAGEAVQSAANVTLTNAVMESQNLHQHTLPHLQRRLRGTSTLLFVWGAVIHRLLLVLSPLAVVDHVFINSHVCVCEYVMELCNSSEYLCAFYLSKR